MASNILSEGSAKINNQVNKINYYSNLKTANEKLIKENQRLRNANLQNFENPTTDETIKTDVIASDTLGLGRKWRYRAAQVVSNSATGPNNFIVVHRGLKQGITKGMAVLNSNDEVVGKVVDASDNYATIMNLLHKNSIISCKLQNGGNIGSARWDGKSINELDVSGISKTITVKVGDTIITSGFTTSTFQKGYILGTINEVGVNKSSNQHIIKLKTAVDFQNLDFVYILENLHEKEIQQLITKTIKEQ